MGLILDSSVVIDAERGRLDLATRLAAASEPVALSAIGAAEILRGIHGESAPDRRARREALVEKILGSLPVVPFDLVAARSHARLAAELAAQGTPIGLHDLLIGATALANGFGVATRDERSFPRIPGLRVVRW